MLEMEQSRVSIAFAASAWTGHFRMPASRQHAVFCRREGVERAVFVDSTPASWDRFSEAKARRVGVCVA